MSSIHKEALADIKKLREISEKNAQKKLAEAATPRIKEFLDRKFAELTEQQLSSLGPEGFPYEDGPVKVSQNMPPAGYPQPVVGAGPSDFARSQASVQVDSVAVPQMGIGNMGASVPMESEGGVGVLLDLDAVAHEVDKLMNNPQVPTRDDSLRVQKEPIELNVTLKSEEPASSQGGESPLDDLLGDELSGEETLVDDDLVKLVSKDDARSKPLDKKVDKNQKNVEQNDEKDNDNVIYIEPGLTSESARVSFNDMFSQLSRIEEVVSSLKYYSEPSKLVRSANAIQETVRDTKTLKKAIRDGLANQSLTSEQFVALYEVVSQVENSIKSKMKEINSIKFAIEVKDDKKQVKTKKPQTSDKVFYEISDVINQFNESKKVAKKKRPTKNKGITGSIKQKSKEVVYEIDLRGEDKSNKQEAILGNNAQLKLEENKMARHQEIIEISDAELRRALRSARLRESASKNKMHHKADGGSRPDPVVRKFGKANPSKALEFSEIDFAEEVEAADLARTSALSRSEKMPSGVKEAVAKLRRRATLLSSERLELESQLKEARLTNAKLIHANKLIQEKGLSLEAKRRVAKAIDQAESVREVKLVFNTIMEQIGSATANLKEGRVRAGASSRVTRSGSAQGSSAGGNSLSENADLSRMRRLAGMNK